MIQAIRRESALTIYGGCIHSEYDAKGIIQSHIEGNRHCQRPGAYDDIFCIYMMLSHLCTYTRDKPKMYLVSTYDEGKVHKIDYYVVDLCVQCIHKIPVTHLFDRDSASNRLGVVLLLNSGKLMTFIPLSHDLITKS